MTYELSIPLKRGTLELEFDSVDELERKLARIDLRRVDRLVGDALKGKARAAKRPATKRPARGRSKGASRKRRG